MGDEVGIQFLTAESSSKDGMDLIVVDIVMKPVTEFSDSSEKAIEEDNAINYKERMFGGAEMPITKGKVIEIEEDNKIVIEVTENGDGYKVGDKIKVKYDKYKECDLNSSFLATKDVLPYVGDVISIQFWEAEPEGEDGMDLIIVDEATKFVEEYSDNSNNANNENIIQ